MRRSALFVLLLLVESTTAFAQDPPVQQGLQPYDSLHGGDIDTVSVNSGNLDLHIPLVSYPQRGGKIPLGFTIRYYTDGFETTKTVLPGTVPEGGGSYTTAAWFGSWVHVVPDTFRSLTASLTAQQANQYSVVLPDGSAHVMMGTTPLPPAESLDATGFHLDSTGTILTDSNGIRYTLPGTPQAPGNEDLTQPTKVEDTNGNYVTHTNGVWTDTLGRQIPDPPPGFLSGTLSVTFTGCPQGVVTTTATLPWTIPGPGGNVTYQFCYGTYTLNFDLPTDTGDHRQPVKNQNVTLLQAIVMPNGTAWTFGYNTGLGVLTSVGLPTGGTISYSGQLVRPCTATANGYPANYVFAYTSRTINANDANGSQTWTYSVPPSNSFQLQPSTVLAPDGTKSVHTFIAAAACSFLESQVAYNDASGNILKTVSTDYTYSTAPNSNLFVVNVLPIRTTTTWPNGQVTKIEKDYDSGFTYLSAEQNGALVPASYGSVIAQREYDYGSGAPGSLLRTTTTAFQWQNSSSYLTNNLIELPSSVTISDSSGTRAITQYAYDQSALGSSGISTQHDANPPAGSAPGNLTSTSRLLNSGSLTCPGGGSGGSNSYVINHTTYFDTGTTQTATDPCGHATTFAYSSTFAGALPTTVTNALNQATNHNYDFNTGLLTSTTDPNGLTNSFSYDNLWRISQIIHPDGGTETITHQETSFPFTATLTKQINASQSKITTNVFDGLGRITQTQLASDPQGTVLTNTSYDVLGRVYTVSNPFRSGSDPSSSLGTTTYFYDAIGRKCLEVPPGGTLPTGNSCPTTQPADDLFTSYAGNSTIVTDETARQRRSFTDALGRLTEVDEPGGATPGTQASGLLTIAGSLNSVTSAGSAATAGSGSVSLSGSEKSTVTSPATVSNGSVSINGSEQSVAGPGNYASGSVTLSGVDHTLTINPCLPAHRSCPSIIYDSGTVAIVVNGSSISVSYGQGSTTTTLATALANAINSSTSSVVTATASGATVTVTAKQAGPAGNYSLTASASSNNPSSFPSGSFSASTSGSTLTGGANTTIYDSGTVTVTINGSPTSVSYGSSSSASTVASAMASALTSGSWVNATANGSSLSITSKATGSAANYSLSITSATSSTSFTGPSFTGSASGANLTGGANAVTTFDAGTVTVTINGTATSASYASSSSTSTLASALASALSSGSLVNATASGSSVSFTSKATGASSNYSLSVSASSSNSSVFSPPSFSISASGSALSGGANAVSATTTFDSGTLSVTVGGFTASGIPYGSSSNSTASQVATAVANALRGSGSPVTVASVSGATVSLTYNGIGTAGNVGITVTPTSSNPSQFPSGSFASSGSLSGGTNTVPASFSTPAITLYTYDALGNLLTVNQQGGSTNSANWHTRTFTNDSLSRLLTSANPEVGTITYAYDPDGNVLTKTDARGITTTYAYDALNREKSVSYSNGDPSISINYDESNCLGLSTCQNIGHRTSMIDAAGSESWSYQVDATNHRSAHINQRITSGISKTATYYLDLAGNVTQAIYPTGRIVNYNYDSANRPSTATDGSNGITYATDFQTPPAGCVASAACYTPQGSFYALSIGQSSSFTGFNINHTYNTRLQPNEFRASSTGGNAIDITYNFVDPTTNGNAGHVYSITNNLNSSRSQSFTYDALNRITSAGTAATSGTYCWGYQYSYDAWANLLAQSPWSANYSGCSQTNVASVTADGNNHISGLTYDASGNTLTDGANTYTWDAESQMKTAAGVTYTYDGDGRRVSKSNGKLYWYGSGSEILAETDASGNTTNEYIFFGGQRIATLPAGSTPLYYAEDFLGSSRVMVQSNGVVCYDADFTPFGGERAYTDTCPAIYKFEGKERDTETGNDDFGARYYSNRLGRWLSSDWSSVPVPVPYANLTNPQTLNLYSMVADDPESFADLDGHGTWDSLTKGLQKAALNFEKGITLAANGYKKAGEAIIGLVNQVGGQVGAGVGEIVAGVESGNDKEVTQGVNRIGSTIAPLLITDGESAAVEAETGIQANRAAGLDFEAKALEKEGLTKNTTPMEAVDPKTGKIGDTIPDAQRANGQTVEAKNVKTLSDSPQLRRQSVISSKSGQKAQVLVNKNNIQKVSPTVQNRMDVRRIDP